MSDSSLLCSCQTLVAEHGACMCSSQSCSSSFVLYHRHALSHLLSGSKRSLTGDTAPSTTGCLPLQDPHHCLLSHVAFSDSYGPENKPYAVLAYIL